MAPMAWVLLAVALLPVVFTVVLVVRGVLGSVVLGMDLQAGTVEKRRLIPGREGLVKWKKKHGDDQAFPLDARSALGTRRGRWFLADVTPGQGRCMTVTASREVLRMSGDRLALLAFGGAIKDIAEASRGDLVGLLRVALFVGLGALILILIALGWVIKTLNDTGALPTGGAA